MGQNRPRLAKPTLDKDLEKFSSVEEAARQMSRRFAGPGTALLFLILAALFAGALVSGQPGAVVVIAASALAAYMAMNIGANDVTNNIGAAVGARAMSMGFGLGLAAVFEIAGAVLGGREVASTIANGIMETGTMASPQQLVWAMMAALLAAAVLINVATWLGTPISTTHAIVGSVMGSGIAAAGFSAVDWGTVAGITATWLVSPLLGAVIAAGFLAFIKEFIIYRADKIAAARQWVPVLIGVMTGTFFGYLVLVGFGKNTATAPLASLSGLAVGIIAWLLAIPVIRAQSAGLDNRNQSLRKLFRLPLVFSAALLSFAHGANDVSNAIGPLAAIVSATQGMSGQGMSGGAIEIPLWELVIGGFGISLGLLLFGPRLVRLVGAEITKLNPMRAYCVALSAALTVIFASWLGMPVSSTHIAIGAVFGVGFFREWYTRHSRRRFEYMRVRAGKAVEMGETFERNDDELRRRYLVRRSHFMSIIAAWMITLPASAALAALIAKAMFALFV